MAATDSADLHVEHAPTGVLLAELARRGVALEEVERGLCVEALKQSRGIIAAAKQLRLSRHALKRRMIKHEIAVVPALTVGEA